MTDANPEKIGEYARSIETGWVGKVVAVEDCGGDLMYKMVGVCLVGLCVAGGTFEENLSPDDVQWFAHDDVRFLNLKPKE